MEFHFSPNEYFSNSVLTKEYEMKCTPEENDPFSFEGPEIYRCKVSNWLIEFGIPMKLLSQIKMCLNETCNRVQIGVHLSVMFPVKNGWKQGDA